MKNNFSKKFIFNKAAEVILHYEDEELRRAGTIDKIKEYFLSVQKANEGVLDKNPESKLGGSIRNLEEFYRFMGHKKDEEYTQAINETVENLNNLEKMSRGERRDFAMFFARYGDSLYQKDNSDDSD